MSHHPTTPEKGTGMHLHDLIHPRHLQLGLDAKLITIREASDGHRIYNYSDAALYTAGAWDNPAVRQCRGLITDPDGRVVARPWAKFFNHGQAEAGDLDLDAPVEVTDKLDGSLGIIHLDATGQPRVATRGSFESDQAIHATQILRTRYHGLRLNLDQVTPLVEIIYPGNRIVCDYADTDDLILLGGVDIETGEYLAPWQIALEIGWTGPTTTVFPYATLRDALAAPPRPGAEGLCVRYVGHERIVKIKQDDYVRLHRIVTGLSERSVWEHMGTGASIEAMLGDLPDELHSWTREVWGGIAARAARLRDDAWAIHLAILETLPPGWTRKDYAEKAKGRDLITPLLFTILDGRDPGPAIHRSLKPAGDTRARAFSEATA